MRRFLFIALLIYVSGSCDQNHQQQQQDHDHTFRTPSPKQERFITLPIVVVEPYTWQDDKSVLPQDTRKE